MEKSPLLSGPDSDHKGLLGPKLVSQGYHTKVIFSTLEDPSWCPDNVFTHCGALRVKLLLPLDSATLI